MVPWKELTPVAAKLYSVADGLYTRFNTYKTNAVRVRFLVDRIRSLMGAVEREKNIKSDSAAELPHSSSLKDILSDALTFLEFLQSKTNLLKFLGAPEYKSKLDEFNSRLTAVAVDFGVHLQIDAAAEHRAVRRDLEAMREEALVLAESARKTGGDVTTALEILEFLQGEALAKSKRNSSQAASSLQVDAKNLKVRRDLKARISTGGVEFNLPQKVIDKMTPQQLAEFMNATKGDTASDSSRDACIQLPDDAVVGRDIIAGLVENLRRINFLEDDGPLHGEEDETVHCSDALLATDQAGRLSPT